MKLLRKLKAVSDCGINMYGTTPIKVLRRETRERKRAYKKAEQKSFAHDVRTGAVRIMQLTSVMLVFGTVLPASQFA